MATEESFVQHVVEQSGLGGRLTFRKMFGEFALYLDGRVLAFACDNQLFLKPTDAVRGLFRTPPLNGTPYPNAKMHWLLADELEDRELLARLLVETARALPAPKPKKPRAVKTARTS